MLLSRFLPPVNRAMRTLDRAFFKKRVPVTAARVLDATLLHAIKEKVLTDLIPFERFNQRYLFNSKLEIETPLLILRPEVKYDDLSTASDPTREYVKSKILELVPYNLKLGYGDWSYEEIMKAVLPEDANPPDISVLSRIGPLLYLDVPEPLREYQRLIAEVICDKEREVQTVFAEPEKQGEASRLGFVNEVLAGPQSYHVELSHQGSSFTFHLDNAKFRDAYFDTKLAAERNRLVDSFGLGRAVADVYSGVGALGIAAAKRGSMVFANEQKPNVYGLLVENRRNNKVKKNLYVKNQSPTKFVQQLVRKLFLKTVDYKPKKRSKLGQLIKNPLKKGDKNLPACVSHFVFGDPRQSLADLHSLRGIYAGREKLWAEKENPWEIDFPFVHVYAYHEAPAEKEEDAVKGLLKAISKKISYDLRQEFVQQARYVKKGPTKNLYCITFKLPPPVAFDITEEELRQKHLEMDAARSDDREPGKTRVSRTNLFSRDSEINRFGRSEMPPIEEKVSESTLPPGAPTQIASSSTTSPTDIPAYSPARVAAPQRPPGYIPLTSFQPRDAGSVARKQLQVPPADGPLTDRGPPMTSNKRLIKTESELMKEFARNYKEPKGLAPWRLKVHRKGRRASWMAKEMRRQQELAYLTQRSSNQTYPGNGGGRGPGYWGSSQGEGKSHSGNSPALSGYGPHKSTEGVVEGIDRHSIPPQAVGSRGDGHADREETRPSRPLIRFHIAANKTPKGGPNIRWHEVDTHPKMPRY